MCPDEGCEDDEKICSTKFNKKGIEVELCLCPEEECSQEDKICETTTNEDGIEQEVCECKRKGCETGKTEVCTE